MSLRTGIDWQGKRGRAVAGLRRRGARALAHYGSALLQWLLPVVVVPVGIQRIGRRLYELLAGVGPLDGDTPVTTLVLVFDGAAVCRVLADRTRFDVTEYERKMKATFGRFLLGLDFDSEEYQEQVHLLRSAMAPEDRERVQDVARSACQAAIAAAAATEAPRSIDVVTMTERVLSRFVEEYFGVPPIPSNGAKSPTLTALNQATASYVFSPDIMTGHLKNAASEAGRKIHEHLASVVAKERQPGSSPGADTVVKRLVRSSPDDERVRTVLGGTISGLFVPTTSQFLAVVDRLLDLPARERDAVHALAVQHTTGQRSVPELDDHRLLHYVIEAARFTPFPAGLLRHAASEQELETGRGWRKTVPANSTVLAMTASAVYDARLVEHPGDFLVGRPETQYVLFGTGQHHCVGGSRQRPLAQILMTEMTAALFALPGLERAPGKRGTIQKSGSWPASFELIHA
jgi:cytochrome P450